MLLDLGGDDVHPAATGPPAAPSSATGAAPPAAVVDPLASFALVRQAASQAAGAVHLTSSSPVAIWLWRFRILLVMLTMQARSGLLRGQSVFEAISQTGVFPAASDTTWFAKT